ncbi:CAP domain-containing protein [Fennellomyces sp. T-0311]|nr:CAP domain-containing protein [Fennellomyces sp. T-0311]
MPEPTTQPTTTKAATTSAPIAAESESASGSSESETLDLHNKFRAEHSAPDLKWNSTLAEYAQKWSDRCVFEHSSGPYGENLAMGYGDWTSAITAWYDEYKDYDFSNPGFASGTGHFTQVVWIGTTDLGCGVSDCNGRPLYTCSYYPPGNIVSGNAFSENVKAN